MNREIWDIYMVENGNISVIQKELSLDDDTGWGTTEIAAELGFSCHKVLEWGDPDEGDNVYFELYCLHENNDPYLGRFEYLVLENVGVFHCILFKNILDVNTYLATMAPIMSYQIQV